MPDLFIAEENTNQTPSSGEFVPPNPTQSQQNIKQSPPPDPKVATKPISKPKPGFTANFVENPSGISFENQETGEEILLFLRRDFVTNVPWILATILLILLPFLLIFVTPFAPHVLEAFPPAFMFLIKSFYFVAVATYAYANYISWYFNVSLVTNIRVMDVDYSDILYINVAGTKINLIQDVSFTKVGAIRSIFNYGDVLVQTAGAVDNFQFEAVPRPDHVVEVVEKIIGKEKNGI